MKSGCSWTRGRKRFLWKIDRCIEGESTGEIVFNTAMSGYQEILTDPSYRRQIITFTYPQIGNTGINPEDYESDKVWASGLVLRSIPKLSSNWRKKATLRDFLLEQNVVGIAEVDTRRLTTLLREKGSMGACVLAKETISDEDEKRLFQLLREFRGFLALILRERFLAAEGLESDDMEFEFWLRTPGEGQEKSRCLRFRHKEEHIAYSGRSRL